MFESIAILPRAGIGALRFGQPRATVRGLLGDPTDVDTTAVPGRETWEYEEFDIDVSFDDDADWRVTSLCVQHPRFTLRGESLIGLPFDRVIGLVPRLRLGRCEQSDESPFGPTLEFAECDVTVAFRDGIADLIVWCAPIDERDEYVWPTLRIVE